VKSRKLGQSLLRQAGLQPSVADDQAEGLREIKVGTGHARMLFAARSRGLQDISDKSARLRSPWNEEVRMRCPARVAVVAAMFMPFLAACSEGGASPKPSESELQASPAVTICDQFGAAGQLFKDADTGAYTAEELTPRALELRDWFWGQAKELKASGQDYVVYQKASGREKDRTASYDLKFEGTEIGSWANGETPTYALTLLTSIYAKDFDCQ